MLREAVRFVPLLTLIAATAIVSQGVATSAHAVEAETPETCVVALAEPYVHADLCKLQGRELLVRVTIPRETESMVVEAIFPATSSSDSSNGAASVGQFWRRISATEGDGIITLSEQQGLRIAVLTVGPDRLDINVRSVVDFLANFIEPGTHLEPFERPPQVRLFGFMKNGFTPICNFIGKELEAHFTVKGLFTNALTPIGQEETRCRGRCGYGCDQPLQWRKNQYTQECLNHDSCRDHTGQQFGECEDEFWAAAEGYLSAPDCPALPTPIAPVPPLPPIALP